MLQARKVAFWLSLLAALVGGVAAYGLIDTGVATEVASPSTEATSAEEVAVKLSAWQIAMPYAATSLFAVVAFAAAWHGGAVSAMDEPVSAAPLWGLVPAMLIAASGSVFILLLLWVFKNPHLLEVISWSLPLAVCAGLAWELGYLGVRPWAPKSNEPSHGHA